MWDRSAFPSSHSMTPRREVGGDDDRPILTQPWTANWLSLG